MRATVCRRPAAGIAGPLVVRGILPAVLAAVPVSTGAGPALAAPAAAQTRVLFEVGKTSELVADAGERVRFADLFETSLASWIRAGKAPGGECAYAAAALPVKPNGLAWNGKPKELLAAGGGARARCTDNPPVAMVRVRSDQVFSAIAGEESIRLAAHDSDGKALGLKATHRPAPSGSADLFALPGLLVLHAAKGAVGFPLDGEAKPEPLPALAGALVAVHPLGWAVTGDGHLRRVADPRAAPGKQVVGLPARPSPGMPVFMLEDRDGFVFAGCAGGALGLWRLDGSSGKSRVLFRGQGVGCPAAVRVMHDRRVLVASVTIKNGKREAVHVTLVAPSGKPHGASLRADLPPSSERGLGLAQAGDWATVLWAADGGDTISVHGADVTIGGAGLAWSADANQ